jgi:hypothetical protein
LFFSFVRVAAMNLKQMAILTATVVALVVIVTLVKVGLGGLAGGGGQQGPTVELTKPHLNFTTTRGPASPFDDKIMPDREAKVEGHHDFWFANENDAPVELFVTKVSCNRCLTVKVGLAPEGATEAPAPESGVDWKALETEEVRDNAKGTTVPAKRGGWVRLTWKDEEASGKILSADLRTTSVGHAPNVRLEFGAVFVEPVRVLPEGNPPELDVGMLASGDDRPHVFWFTVYSSTRASFSLEAESEVNQARHPFVTCGTPVKLSDEECRAREKEHKRAFLCAYKVPLTVRERLKDGHEHDLGPFRTGVTLKSDALEDDLALYVHGTVRTGGLRVVGDEKEEDRVVLGTFRRDIETVKTVRVETPRGTALKLDRKPEFMDVELKDESDNAGKTWALTVTVKANTVNGRFPRLDDPALRDTSIYLKANERPLRIPVSGTASQR